MRLQREHADRWTRIDAKHRLDNRAVHKYRAENLRSKLSLLSDVRARELVTQSVRHVLQCLQ
jgi:hypothetical protein